MFLLLIIDAFILIIFGREDTCQGELKCTTLKCKVETMTAQLTECWKHYLSLQGWLIVNFMALGNLLYVFPRWLSSLKIFIE